MTDYVNYSDDWGKPRKLVYSNPYSKKCVHLLKLYQNNDFQIAVHPVLHTKFTTLYRYILSSNCEKFESMILDFEKKCKYILARHNTAIYVYAAILYFIILIQYFFAYFYRSGYGNWLAWCLNQEDYWAGKLADSLYIINNKSYEKNETIKILYDELLETGMTNSGLN